MLLTRREAIELTIDLWSWLADNPDSYKDDYFDWHPNVLQPEFYECYLCDWTLSQMPDNYQREFDKNCHDLLRSIDKEELHCNIVPCPLAKHCPDNAELSPCEGDDADYYNWRTASDAELRTYHANRIVVCMKKELEPSVDLCPDCGAELESDGNGVFCDCGFKEDLR